jgi:hypothetical protein
MSLEALTICHEAETRHAIGLLPAGFSSCDSYEKIGESEEMK